jgi:hypothetical protein
MRFSQFKLDAGDGSILGIEFHSAAEKHISLPEPPDGWRWKEIETGYRLQCAPGSRTPLSAKQAGLFVRLVEQASPPPLLQRRRQNAKSFEHV